MTRLVAHGEYAADKLPVAVIAPAKGSDQMALSNPEPDPQVVHAAIEEVRQIASQNVIAVLGSKIDSQGAKIDILAAKIDSQGAEIRAEIKAQTARIDILQRVIWPLIAILATSVFGLLYKAVTG